MVVFDRYGKINPRMEIVRCHVQQLKMKWKMKTRRGNFALLSAAKNCV